MTMTKFSRINKQREEITMRVLEDMEKGGNEWKKPWVEASPLPPHNPVSGTQYSGRNFLYTYVYGMMRGYADPRWATEKQIKEMGWKIPENLQNGRGGINDELGVRTHGKVNSVSSCARRKHDSPVKWSSWKNTSTASSLFGVSGSSAWSTERIHRLKATKKPGRSTDL